MVENVDTGSLNPSLASLVSRPLFLAKYKEDCWKLSPEILGRNHPKFSQLDFLAYNSAGVQRIVCCWQ